MKVVEQEQQRLGRRRVPEKTSYGLEQVETSRATLDRGDCADSPADPVRHLRDQLGDV
jgi:hypothetical protein